MPDERVKRDVRNQLNWDCRLDASQIEVEVSEGTVTLTGTVPNYLARQTAELDAFTVPGVLSVENDLHVRYPEPRRVPRDSEVRKDIENLFRCNVDIDAADIGVFVVDGSVTLEGTVESLWQKGKAEDLAATVTGVITNNIAVVPSKSFNDVIIADDILSALERNINVNVAYINVKVENGRVVLSGKAPNLLVYRTVYDTARHTRGVVEVENNLSIGGKG